MDRGADGGEDGEAANWRSVLAVGEFRVLWIAQAASLLGDQLARIAIAWLVFRDTGSALLTAVTYAVTFLPWVVGGPLLGGLADRHPLRTVMVTCSLLSGVFVAVISLPGLPLWVLCGLLFVVVLLESPFLSARAALLVEVLPDDRYVLASALGSITMQVVQIAGFPLGGLLVAVLGPRSALLADAATFLLGAVLVRFGVRFRPAPVTGSPGGRGAPGDPDQPAGRSPSGEDGPGEHGRSAEQGISADRGTGDRGTGDRAPGDRGTGAAAEPGSWAGTGTGISGWADRLASGWRAVFADPPLRGLVLLAWLATFSVVPEGLAAPYAALLGGGGGTVGMLLAAEPAGAALGAVVLSRLVPPRRRARLMVPLAALASAPLLGYVARPTLPVALGLLAVSGLGGSYQLVANATFMQTVPVAVRGQAFALATAGLFAGQGLGFAVAGALAEVVSPALVVAGAGLLGVLLVIPLRDVGRRFPVAAPPA